jgi:hypothetical protein
MSVAGIDPDPWVGMEPAAPVADPVAALSSALSLSQYQGGLTIVVDQTTVAAYHQSWLISL